ncbi:MAG: hypothetical protein V7K55_12580 [Nostoc sp.]|uniref:hypothetical protein n=1 Tax=Nostoc sp. TaxID=1180 RepID=UPI002FF7E861
MEKQATPSNDRKIRQASREDNFKAPQKSDKKYMFDFLRSAIADTWVGCSCGSDLRSSDRKAIS